jgi:hypothetical protein
VSRAHELAQDARGAVRSAAQTANNAYVSEMAHRAEAWITDLEQMASETERLRDALVKSHVHSLDLSLALAESDPLYAEVLRPLFKRIAVALGMSA